MASFQNIYYKIAVLISRPKMVSSSRPSASFCSLCDLRAYKLCGRNGAASGLPLGLATRPQIVTSISEEPIKQHKAQKSSSLETSGMNE
jgi:hypothetical protein